MKNFAAFIRTIPDKSAPPVKTAVIDNGVDASLDMFDGKIALSRSFCPDPNSTDLMRADSVLSQDTGPRWRHLSARYVRSVNYMWPNLKNATLWVEDDNSRPSQQRRWTFCQHLHSTRSTRSTRSTLIF